MTDLYSKYKEKFESKEFQLVISKLEKKLKNKQVIIYCNGVYFEAFSSVYDLNNLFNIVGVSDLRYETENYDIYKGFKCFKPSELKNQKYDCLIITSENFESIKKSLINNKLVSKTTKFIKLDIKPRIGDKFRAIKNFYGETFSIGRSIKYFLACTVEEIIAKTNYQKVLKRLKVKTKIRIIFVCEENSKWGYQSVYEKLVKDSKFEVLPIVLYPIKTSTRTEFTQEKNKVFFDELGIETIDGYDYEKNENKSLEEYNPDIVFYQQPWYLEGKNHPVNVSKYALTMMIPYGYTTLSAKEWGSDLVKKVYSNLFRFFSESKYHTGFYEKNANMKNKDILISTGTPKLDGFFEPAKTVLWKGENIKAKVIWAPHHSLGNEGLRMSTFDKNCYKFLEFAKSNPQISFIVKPHPALKNVCEKTGFMSDLEYETYISAWNNLPNGYVYDSGNYIDIFKTSDILITDCSSFLAEYFPSGNPIIFLNRKDRAPFDSFGEKLKKSFYEINEFDEIPLVLENLIENKNDCLKNARKDLINKFFSHKTTSSELIVNHLKKLC